MLFIAHFDVKSERQKLLVTLPHYPTKLLLPSYDCTRTVGPIQPNEEAFYAVSSSTFAKSTLTRLQISALFVVADDLGCETFPAMRKGFRSLLDTKILIEKRHGLECSRHATLFRPLVSPVSPTFLKRQSIQKIGGSCHAARISGRLQRPMVET